MVYLWGKNDLTSGQKEPNFKNRRFIVSNCWKSAQKTTLHITLVWSSSTDFISAHHVFYIALMSLKLLVYVMQSKAADAFYLSGL